MNSLAVGLAVFFGICAIAFAGILIVYVAVSFGGKKKADNNYILYLELTRQAILETSIRGMDYKGPAKLYRAPFPFLDKLNNTIEACHQAIKEEDDRGNQRSSPESTGKENRTSDAGTGPEKETRAIPAETGNKGKIPAAAGNTSKHRPGTKKR